SSRPRTRGSQQAQPDKYKERSIFHDVYLRYSYSMIRNNVEKSPRLSGSLILANQTGISIFKGLRNLVELVVRRLLKDGGLHFLISGSCKGDHPRTR
ncbi:MAG TPA: hypothetical protein VFY26_22065, partial [Anaerolineales bacterium]|nr:hypothetical protein [Anaerolineales bacterium]